ncbi:hypothetical protein AL073_17000 [Loktanella sp. 1ANDIMAR09]|nr:hypothetical protein AL073_17000 [Loktanella sp. 1ANDIMAR09]
MSKGFTDGYFAFGLVLGAAIVIILALAVSDYGAGCYLTNVNSYGYQPEGMESDNKCWLIPHLVYADDTLAQWLMALLTVVAVWMLWKTLTLTRGANEAAVQAATAALASNEIMRQEQRPWVTLERDLYCDFMDRGGSTTIRWNYNFANKGKSPAFDVRFKWKVIRCGRFSYEENLVEDFVNECIAQPVFFKTPLIFPGDKTEFKRNAAFSSFRYEAAEIPESEFNFKILTCLTYSTSVSRDKVGVEARIFGIEHKNKFGPFSAKVLEHSYARFIQ